MEELSKRTSIFVEGIVIGFAAFFVSTLEELLIIEFFPLSVHATNFCLSPCLLEGPLLSVDRDDRILEVIRDGDGDDCIDS